MSSNGNQSVEKREMAGCEGENVVTMMDVLKEQQDFEDDANAVLGGSDEKECTYSQGYIKRQAIYACVTCCTESKDDPSKRAGFCLACSLTCHENHDLIELYTKRNFRCDCGNPKFKTPCQFTLNKANLNEGNVYNQNFVGLYCSCNQPYDPESVDDEMIQCIICEDWWHSSHLDAIVPAHDQYSEMICKMCMMKNEFLHDYTELAINDSGDIDVVKVNEDEGKGDQLDNAVHDKLNNGDATADVLTNGGDTGAHLTNGKDFEDAMETSTTEVQEDASIAETNIENLNDEESSEKQETEAQTTVAEILEEKTNAVKETEETDKAVTEEDGKIDEVSEDNPESTNSLHVTEGTDIPDDNESAIDKTDVDSTSDLTVNEKILEENVEESSDDIKGSKSELQNIEGPENSSETPNAIENSDSTDKSETETSEYKFTEDQEINNDGANEVADENSGNAENEKVVETPNEEPFDSIKSIETSDDIEMNEISNKTANQKEADSEEKNVEKLDSNKDANLKENEVPAEHKQTTSEVAEVTSENKRKMSTEDSLEVLPVKKTKIEEKCIRPKGVKKAFKGATFWPSHFRQKLCTCGECILMYKDLNVHFLTDVDDTVFAYEALGKERTAGKPNQYEKGIEALCSLGRTQQIDALTEYNKMRDKLITFLQDFKERKEIVTETDIKSFFASMNANKPEKRMDGVYFCR